MRRGFHKYNWAFETAKLATTAASGSSALKKLAATLEKIGGIEHEDEKAKKISTDLTAAMDELRASCDQIETLVADDCWTLPKYREMLIGI